MSAADDEDPGQGEAEQDRLQHRPARAGLACMIRPRCRGPEANAPIVHTAARPAVAG